MMLEKRLGACNDFLLLGPGYAGGRATEVPAVAQAYFREHQQLSLPHDQIYFATSAAIVGLDQAKPPGFEVALRNAFSYFPRAW